MSQVNLEREEQAAPLLLELSRAVRARQFYPATHPALQDVLKRTHAVWREGLQDVDELHLELRSGCFVLPGGASVRGPGIDELAQDLRYRRVKRLRVHSGFEPTDLLALIDALVEEIEAQASAGGVERSLLNAGATHITTTEVDFGEHFSRAEAESESPPNPEDSMSDDFITDEDEEAPQEDALPTAEELRAQAIQTLDTLLEELETSEELSDYHNVANRIEEQTGQMLQFKNEGDAYSAVLTFCRHASYSSGRSPEIRQEAQNRMALIAENPTMLDLIVDHACDESGMSSVHATQVLMCMGSSIVGRLLERHEDGGPLEQSQITAILIAMGDSAFPMIVHELSNPDDDRVRRAVRLLGRMQNPRGVEHLVPKLSLRNADLQSETARALARIGTDQAVHTLVRTSQKNLDLANVAAVCLGDARSAAAVHALARFIEPKARFPDHVKREAIRSLGRIRNLNALGPLKRILDRRPLLGRKRHRALRIAAAQAIGRIGGADAAMALSAHARRGDPNVQQACREALDRMSGAEEL